MINTTSRSQKIRNAIAALLAAASTLIAAEAGAMWEERENMQQSISPKNYDIMRAAIEDTCTYKSEELYKHIIEKIDPLKISIDDIKSLAISEEEAKNIEFPVVIYLPKQESLLSTAQVKKAFIAGLIYPTELQDDDADFVFIQRYQSIPWQLSISAAYFYPPSINALKSLLIFSSLEKYDKEHLCIQMINSLKESIDQMSFQKIFIKRLSPILNFTSKKKQFNLNTEESVDFFNNIVSIYETI